MFHQRRRSPLADFLDWTDYRVGGAPPPLHGFARGRHANPWERLHTRRRSPLARLLIGIAIVVAVVFIVQQLTGRRRSNWL